MKKYKMGRMTSREKTLSLQRLQSYASDDIRREQNNNERYKLKATRDKWDKKIKELCAKGFSVGQIYFICGSQIEQELSFNPRKKIEYFHNLIVPIREKWEKCITDLFSHGYTIEEVYEKYAGKMRHEFGFDPKEIIEIFYNQQKKSEKIPSGNGGNR